MSEIKIGNLFKVEIIESERGWGTKIDEVKYFESEQEAKNFCTNYNKTNPSDHVPDWYMQANYCGRLK